MFQEAVFVSVNFMFLTRAADFLFDAWLNLLYPQACAVCGGSVEARELGVACAGCWQSTRILTADDVVCWKCGARMGPEVGTTRGSRWVLETVPSAGIIGQDKREQVRCRRCDEDMFAAARACGAYEGALRASILRLKREPFIPRHLVLLLKETQQRVPLSNSTRVIPVPLHAEREKARGFNQAAVIARAVARAAALPLDEVSLLRTTHAGRHRAGMDRKARRASVAEAFKVRYPRLIVGESVLLVDDVFTTGATASSCASALLSSGAQEVFVLTIARPTE